MAKSKNPSLDKKKEEKSILENLVEEVKDATADPSSFAKNAEEVFSISKSIKKAFNPTQARVDSLKHAKDRIKLSSQYYFSEEMLKNPLLIERLDMDSFALARIYFQILAAEHGQEILIKSLDEGDTHPRYHEVFSNSNKDVMNLIESFRKHIIALDNEYRLLRREFEDELREQQTLLDAKEQAKLMENNDVQDAEIVPEMRNRTYRGNRELLQALEQEERDSTIDVPIEENEEGDDA